MNESVSQEELARVFVSHFDRLQGVDYVLFVLVDHLHARGLIDPKELASSLRAVAVAAADAQSQEQAMPAQRLADSCEHLTAPPEGGGPPAWLQGVIRGGRP